MRLSLPFALRPLLGMLALSALLAGCGGGSSGNGVSAKSADDIVAAAKVAADAAASAHVSGSVVSNGTPITLDLNLLANKGGRGQLSESGLSFELIQTGGAVYIKGSPAFYKHVAGNAAAQLLQGKWLKAPTSNTEFSSLTSLVDLRQLVDTTLSNHGKLAKGATTTINGQKVIGVTDTTKGGTLYVATTGKPYPVQISKGGSTGGKITFDRWNEAVSVTAPANAIDITQLQSGH